MIINQSIFIFFSFIERKWFDTTVYNSVFYFGMAMTIIRAERFVNHNGQHWLKTPQTVVFGPYDNLSLMEGRVFYFATDNFFSFRILQQKVNGGYSKGFDLAETLLK